MIKFHNIKWIDRHGALIPVQIPHNSINLTKLEQKELLDITKAYFLRWTSSFDDKKGEFWYIIKDVFYGMDELSSNTRSKIRRGYKKLYSKKINKINYINDIYKVYIETSKKYNTFENIMSKEEFIKYIKNLDNEKYEFYGVFDKERDELVAYSQNFISENTCFYEEMFFHPKYLKNYCSYVLIYDMNKYYLEDKKLSYVHDGSRNLSHITEIHQFLISKFKFRKAYSKMEIAYRSDIKFIVNLIYPLRKIFYGSKLNIMKKISILLKHEEIRRSYLKISKSR